ncbi:hypothetical protein SAY86_019399 [Trapa natans]|uniref:T-complex protein 1 subunit eta n=1 Tax=Trapa natans TaxID=22666 RepID=A0AAN7LXJ3_TRANT|nr:hypothetical protein SAY86_019399 [Trapa natans]
MELSRYLRQHARTIARKYQLFINSCAKALEVIPGQLCDNAGFDATDVLNKLRQKHAFPSATEAACLILSVDETVKNPKSESAQGEAAASGHGWSRPRRRCFPWPGAGAVG